jgi:hypothetical protein
MSHHLVEHGPPRLRTLACHVSLELLLQVDRQIVRIGMDLLWVLGVGPRDPIQDPNESGPTSAILGWE